jgi:hypothetical protein
MMKILKVSKHRISGLFPKMSLIFIFICILNISVTSAAPRPIPGQEVRPAIFALSKVMMHDVVSPTIASRYYMYATLGAASILSHEGHAFPHPSRYIRHLPDTIGQISKDAHPSLTALFCIYETGMRMLPSGADVQSDYDAARNRLRQLGYSNQEMERASLAAASVANSVLSYAAGDGYNLLSRYPRYRPRKKEGYWFPTPPAYMEAADPHWGKMRTMVIDSAGQFKSPPPAPFDTTTGSDFRQLMDEVRRIGAAPTPEQREIAGFWDCNPFVIATSGHMTLGFKKISPGGHWMNIACLAAEIRGIDVDRTMMTAFLEAVTLYDAFIVCWTEKYRTDRVRPESVIHRYVDVNWQPMLQTPPFPEYTSGHSVISSASAEVLTFLLGDSLAYSDDTEVMFELPVRRFTSFRHAAREASISRLYGGIHFRDAIEQGQATGIRIGLHVVDRIRQAGMLRF